MENSNNSIDTSNTTNTTADNSLEENQQVSHNDCIEMDNGHQNDSEELVVKSEKQKLQIRLDQEKKLDERNQPAIDRLNRWIKMLSISLGIYWIIVAGILYFLGFIDFGGNEQSQDVSQPQEQSSFDYYLQQNTQTNNHIEKMKQQYAYLVPKSKRGDVERSIEFDKNFFDHYMFKTPMKQLKWRAERMQIIGHQGGFEPANTMKAIKMAKQAGLKTIQVDVELSKDWVPFVMKAGINGQLDDFIKQKGQHVQDYSAAQLEAIKLPRSGEKIPRLEQVLRYCRVNDLKVVLDLNGIREEIVKEVVELIWQTGMTQHVEISSFIDRHLLLAGKFMEHKKMKNVRLTQVYGLRDFSLQKAREQYKKHIKSVSVACSEYYGNMFQIAKQEMPDLNINCWFYERDISWSIKQESFEGYLRALDRDVDSVIVNNPQTYKELVKETVKK